ncbi:MAG: OmpA family protein [Deltaproteobacteria bacterium]|nr:OmpA family protein [Deltaproteobacteria bacterium]
MVTFLNSLSLIRASSVATGADAGVDHASEIESVLNRAAISGNNLSSYEWDGDEKNPGLVAVISRYWQNGGLKGLNRFLDKAVGKPWVIDDSILKNLKGLEEKRKVSGKAAYGIDLEAITKIEARQVGAIKQGKVLSDRGLPVAARVEIKGPKTVIVETSLQGGGGFSTALPPGSYQITAMADGYFVKIGTVNITPGEINAPVLVLRPLPKSPSVRLLTNKILMLRPVVFTNRTSAELTDESRLILDEVADLMIRHPEIKRLRIQGNTDSRGSEDQNIKISQERADAVVAYLIRSGVEPQRLEAVGLGEEFPVAPNIAATGRSRNNRIEFTIAERDESAVKPASDQ